MHPITTLTLTREQLLAGVKDGAAPATIAGELRLPFVASPRMPAVILLHGDAGELSNQVAWSDELNAIGIAVFTLDSFTGRGAVATEIGSGYFGRRHPDGSFSDEKFVANATDAQVRMIEVKLSQGAKPGHGGVLPSAKV